MGILIFITILVTGFYLWEIRDERTVGIWAFRILWIIMSLATVIIYGAVLTW